MQKKQITTQDILHEMSEVQVIQTYGNNTQKVNELLATRAWKLIDVAHGSDPEGNTYQVWSLGCHSY
ncbi:Uncharacterised protein [Serratia entomophila]|uniref:hypothetical protein n=1 Tax=Serratia entomophila TaxID=42906 RepID=UPI00217777A2|nr:hypothetical protein [Serratia entomophila]CAI0750276.1 Uncharacterised protein [Serratia entomophila]CAI0762657.1 Uncharacterised protein [Serratia entomophila]CAI2067268.1 Uncharacterised protein [Serratia entomophila]